MKVADMTVEQLADLIRAIVAEELETWRDDNEGELRPEFLAELQRRHREPGERYSEAQLMERLGITVER